MKPYNKNNISLAKELRKNMTPQERKLWYEFLRCYKVRFQRQKAIGNYIADFYCAKAKLVIELDGGGHYYPMQIEKDTNRTADLEQMDLQVLRICNLDIDRNFQGVCEYIDMIVNDSLPQSRRLDSCLRCPLRSLIGACHRQASTSSEGAMNRYVQTKPPSDEGGGKAQALTEGEINYPSGTMCQRP